MRKASAVFGLIMVFGTVASWSRAHAQTSTVGVLYAGSLLNIMEHGIGPAFSAATKINFQGTAGGSQSLADQVKERSRRGDVFVSASPGVDASLMGDENRNWLGWYITFAQSPLVIGLNSTSRFAATLRTKPWYDVITDPTIRIGRTDPKLDPKGTMTLRLLDKAEHYYGRPGLHGIVPGADANPAQVLPEETLVDRLQAGRLDIGFFYTSETTDANIPTIPLPDEIAQQAVYTVSILRDAQDPQAAEAFVRYLLGPEGEKVLKIHGLDRITATISGDESAVPPSIKALVETAAKP